MRIAHISDVHLGYRAYNRVTTQGINRREADVFAAFRRAMDEIAAISPDLILIAGDLFHVVRPSNLTIQQTFKEFLDLRRKTGAPVVIIGGNHDSPRSADTGCILDLLTNIPDLYVAHGSYVQVPIQSLETSVFCLCHRALPNLSDLKIEPDPGYKRNVLMVHGTVEGVIRHDYDLYQLSRSQVITDAWDYIAFGHYHLFTELAPNAWYSGSVEFTSTSTWAESGQEKGFIEYDLDERRLIAFHKIPTREVVDLRPIDSTGFTAEEVSRMIENRVGGIVGGHKDKIVRLVVENIDRAVKNDLDYALIRSIRTEALHFELQLRAPSRDGRSASDDNGARMAKSLEEEWQEFAGTLELAGGVDRERLTRMGLGYLTSRSDTD